ncbi:hypothetical protein GGTG_04352 [Gaeumannomyces tritici R3-111a-1]|uniref:Uncharacterized protein n=1 Tax=Gaeumannomyces tritici (strain R3-111a-1) TaxID=644352 RepID=J3NSV3_GAET3|nr:hypothetical protein GGTG_04352 [Gaeumannomyces tritici R3-111a-1]EJT79266.1 hypothetical protein GGTG_04352 [Gaeumannomyces tritici R3-111a-1]
MSEYEAYYPETSSGLQSPALAVNRSDALVAEEFHNLCLRHGVDRPSGLSMFRHNVEPGAEGEHARPYRYSLDGGAVAVVVAVFTCGFKFKREAPDPAEAESAALPAFVTEFCELVRRHGDRGACEVRSRIKGDDKSGRVQVIEGRAEILLRGVPRERSSFEAGMRAGYHRDRYMEALREEEARRLPALCAHHQPFAPACACHQTAPNPSAAIVLPFRACRHFEM